MNMSDEEIAAWFEKCQFASGTRALITRLRESEPSRNVRSGRHNTRGRYASTRNELSVQYESGTGELLVAVMKNYDSHTLEYYDQPESIILRYKALKGRSVGVRHTSDFFCLERERAGWQEWKTEEELRCLSATMPNRYVKTEQGQWRCPPGEAHAEPFGLFYEVHAYEELSDILFQNLKFLADYLDYPNLAISEPAKQEIQKCLSDSPGLSLLQLGEELKIANRNDLHILLAQGQIYVDLSAAPLTKPGYVYVYRDRPTGEAYRTMLSCQMPVTSPPMIDLTTGGRIMWDGVWWQIANVGETQISLLGEGKKFTHVSYEYFRTLIQTGKITGIASGANQSMSDGDRRILEAPIEALKDANYRWDLVQLYRQYRQALQVDEVQEDQCVMAKEEFESDLARLVKKHGRTEAPALRTLRYYDRLATEGERIYGNAWINLLSRVHLRGSRAPKLDEATVKLMDKIINDNWLTKVMRKGARSWGEFSLRCEQEGLAAASLKTFLRRIKTQKSEEQQVREREGKGEGYQRQGPVIQPKRELARHGTYPWDQAHIDHTPVSLPLFCPDTGMELGQAWLSAMILSFPRRIVAILVMFRPPSEVTNLMLCRICVWRYQRLPRFLVTDNGSEFEGTSFQTFMGRYKMSHHFRPPGEPRHGAEIEKFFGTAQTQFLHNLPDNTQTGKSQGTPPKERGLVKTLGGLYVACSRYAYDVYDTLQHSELGMSPREAYERGMASAGERTHTLIPYDETFRILSLPLIGRTGKVHVRPGKGFRHQYKDYWTDEFRLPTVENTDVLAREDPFDQGYALAQVQDRWVECLNSQYTLFRGRSAAECVMAAEEWRRRRRLHGRAYSLNAIELARFLRTLEEEPQFKPKMTAHTEDKKLAALINGNPEFFRSNKTGDSLPAGASSGSISNGLNQSGGSNQLRSAESSPGHASQARQRDEAIEAEQPTDHGEF